MRSAVSASAVTQALTVDARGTARTERRPGRVRTPVDGARRRPGRAGGASQCRHRRRCRSGASLRRAGDRAVPDRAHVPRRATQAGRAGHPGPRRRRASRAPDASCLPLQRKDFGDILAAMDGLPVTIRLLDPPLHEFLPDLTALSVEVAVAEATGTSRPGQGRPAAAGPAAARAEPDARHARRTARHRRARALRAAGARRGRGVRRSARAGPGPAAGDHDPAGRGRPGARAAPGADRARDGRRGERAWPAGGPPDRDHDRAAPGGDDGAPDRGGGRLLLVRHQRPDPDRRGGSAGTT